MAREIFGARDALQRGAAHENERMCVVKICRQSFELLRFAYDNRHVELTHRDMVNFNKKVNRDSETAFYVIQLKSEKLIEYVNNDDGKFKYLRITDSGIELVRHHTIYDFDIYTRFSPFLTCLGVLLVALAVIAFVVFTIYLFLSDIVRMSYNVYQWFSKAFDLLSNSDTYTAGLAHVIFGGFQVVLVLCTTMFAFNFFHKYMRDK